MKEPPCSRRGTDLQVVPGIARQDDVQKSRVKVSGIRTGTGHSYGNGGGKYIIVRERKSMYFLLSGYDPECVIAPC